MRSDAENDDRFNGHMRSTADRYEMSPAERDNLVDHARQRRRDEQLTEKEAARRYLYADMQLDAIISAHDLVKTPMFKERVDAQNARGDDVTGWLAQQQYDAEEGFQRIEAELARRDSPSMRAMISACRQDKQATSETRREFDP